MAHWPMSTWWAPQSVSLPPEYSYHQRKSCVAALLDVVDLRRLAQPHVPVQLAGGLLLGEGAAGGTAADGRGHPLDLADASGTHQRDGQEEDPVVIAPLLGADLHDAARLLGDPAEHLALVDRQRQRLLAVDVLARLHGVDADLGVPVVGRADDDGVDVLAVEELAVVLVDVGLPFADVLVSLARSACRLVDVADGEEVAVAGGPPGVARALATGADQAEAGPIVLGPGLVGHRPTGRGDQGQEQRARRRNAEEIPPVLRLLDHRRELPAGGVFRMDGSPRHAPWRAWSSGAG